MQCQGGLPDAIGLVVDPGNEILDGAPAQDSRQAPYRSTMVSWISMIISDF